MITVIMLSYNKAVFLESAIQSVLNQSFGDWELLVSDDHSSDQSWDICQEFARLDPRIKPTRNESQLGIPRNRAAAFSRAKGDFVCHLDCDDMLYPWSLAVARRAFEQLPKLAFAYSDFALIDRDSKVIQYGVNPDFDSDLSRFGWRHFGMYRKGCADKFGGYNRSISRPCEDGDLVIQMAHAGLKITRLPYVLYMHRYLGDNASGLAGKCNECDDQDVCNYYQIWSKYVT